MDKHSKPDPEQQTATIQGANTESLSVYGMDSDQLKKRMSQIELEISEMNDMIDKNLGVRENTEESDEAEAFKVLQNMTANDVDQFVQNAMKSDSEGVADEQPSGKDAAGAGAGPAAGRAAGLADAPRQPERDVAQDKQAVAVEPAAASPVDKTRTVEASTGTEEDQLAVPPATAETPAANDKTNTYPAPAENMRVPVGVPVDAGVGAPARGDASSRSTTPRSHPFRVVHVGSQANSRKSSKADSRVSSAASDSAEINFEQLQKHYNALSMKCNKLQKEIAYLTKFQNESTLTLEDKRKLDVAMVKLQEYLDKKNKQRYDTGVVLSRQIRRNVDSGTNGQFWVGRS